MGCIFFQNCLYMKTRLQELQASYLKIQNTHMYHFKPINQNTPKGEKGTHQRLKFSNSSGYPLSFRVSLFKQEFPEFKTYENDAIQHLIALYDENFDKKFSANSIPSIVAGTYLLWVCWLFFNASAGKTIVNLSSHNLPQATVMNTILSGSASSLVVFYFLPYFYRGEKGMNNYNPVNICNGLLSGLVSVTASCNGQG